MGISGRVDGPVHAVSRSNRSFDESRIVTVANTGEAKDFIESAAMTRGVLADVERHQVQSEDLNLTDQVTDQSAADVRHAQRHKSSAMTSKSSLSSLALRYTAAVVGVSSRLQSGVGPLRMLERLLQSRDDVAALATIWLAVAAVGQVGKQHFVRRERTEQTFAGLQKIP